MGKLTVNEFKQALPPRLRNNVTDTMVDSINNISVDREAANTFREIAVSYGDVLNEGKFKLTSYLEAALYVAHKQLGKTNLDAWACTFPKKHAKYVARGADIKTITAYASMYNKNKLVVAIMERALVPIHILFADEYYRAVKVQVELMTTSTSDTVRQKASEAIMRELKPPMEAKVKVEVTDSSGVMDSLAKAVGNLSKNQRERIIDGSYSTKEIAHTNIGHDVVDVADNTKEE